MSDNIFLPDDDEENSRQRRHRRKPGVRQSGGSQRLATIRSTVLLLVVGLVSCWVVYNQFRIDVGTGQMAVLIRKDGANLTNNEVVAPTSEHRGVQREFLTEGRYFRNPLYWEWQVLDQQMIPSGKLGVLISLAGEELPSGEFLARVDDDGNPLTRGIMPGVLRAGRYPVHPWLFELEQHDPHIVPAGFKGVVTELAGPLPENPNVLLVPDGARGVQEKALDPGTYYVNPYQTRIDLVDCRSQRFNLAQNKDMGFPSRDGFWVSLDGIIEFRVRPEQAAQVYVAYNEDMNGAAIDEEIIRKVILPNARSFCRLEGSNESGRQFIQGETRSQFQANFQAAMRTACEPLGIEIIQALITRISPPEQIAEPVRAREIAKQQEEQYQQQILQQESEQKLAIEKELVRQKQALVQAEQTVIKLTTEALQEQEVAVTQAEERLSVAGLRLDAAKDEAEAVLARGRAEAEVIGFRNEAEAAGWKNSVLAFDGRGGEFARYVLLQKMSGAYQRMMINTSDSPIMRIFESFAPSPPGASIPASVPAAAAETPPSATEPSATRPAATEPAATADTAATP